MTRKTIRIIEIALGAVLVLFIIILFVFVKPQTRKLNSSSSAVSSTVTSINSTSSEPVSSASASSAITSSSKKPTSSVAASTKPTAGSAVTASSQPAADETVSVTIPEGYSLMQICKRLESKGVGDYATLFKTATTADFSSHPCIANSSKTNRCYTLEGYLFPDTYTFYKGQTPAHVFDKMLSNFDASTSAYKSQAAKTGLTFDQAIVLASVIEKEAGNGNEVAKVSSVLHNRLNAKWQLNCDATISYLNNRMSKAECEKYKYYYNTERCAALPAGPICNPGLQALKAAVNPANTNFMYFCNDNADPPNYYYAVTEAEQNANRAKAGIS